MTEEKINSNILFKMIVNLVEDGKLSPAEASSVCLLAFSAISIEKKLTLEDTLQAAEGAIKLAYFAETR